MQRTEHYQAWYHSPRGQWIAAREFALLMRLLAPKPGASLLDVGCGTGHFTRRFAGAGMAMTGIDPDQDALTLASELGGDITYLSGSALTLPFPDGHFDYCSAITSLCFVEPPAQALAEMWRVARHGVVLGLLNRHSLLYRQKSNSGSYRGARWDSLAEVRQWCSPLQPAPSDRRHAYGIFLPSGGILARLSERLIPPGLPWGGFLAVAVHKSLPHV